MFNRRILQNMQEWAKREDRKPLVLRGARQVGKTSAVELLSKEFDQFVHLNLDRAEDRKPFHGLTDIHDLAQAVFLLKNKTLTSGKALLFIDEIQEEPLAIERLRYFYEDLPDLHVICAGSLLETVLDHKVNIPVGRAEYMVVRPVSFREFLEATGETAALSAFDTVPTPSFAHAKLLKLFHTYTFTGGMPEVVAKYAEHRDFTRLTSVYESLIVSYLDDVEKYARSTHQREVIRHAIRSMFFDAGTRIRFEGFGRSNYKSREMGEALRALEKAMLLRLVYPTTDVKVPFKPDRRKSPKLFALDTGLVNYFAGLQPGLIGTQDLNAEYQGRVAEHIVAQEILASSFNVIDRLSFWVREEKHSTAEVDFVRAHGNDLIPVEVKSGSAGHMRSLQQFMNRSSGNLAVRLCRDPIGIEQVSTVAGKTYRLLNLPYYLVSQLDAYLERSRQ